MRRLVDGLEEAIAATAVVVVVLSVAWGVITRYVTEQPAAWASEIATLGFAWIVFFGAAACVKYRLHPTIDMLVERLPASLATLVRGFNHVLLLGFFLFMTGYGGRFAWDSLDAPSPVLRVPLTWLYGAVAASFALMLVRYVQVLAGRRWSLDADRETHTG